MFEDSLCMLCIYVSRVKIFMRFTVIFLRSPLIPLKTLLIFYEPPMRRYRRNSIENWSWPPLFSNEKPLFPPIFYKKTRRYFLRLMPKKVYRIGKPDFRKKKNRRRRYVSCSKMEAIVYRNFRPEMSAKTVANPVWQNETNIRFHQFHLYLWEWRLIDNLISFFLLVTS